MDELDELFAENLYESLANNKNKLSYRCLHLQRLLTTLNIYFFIFILHLYIYISYLKLKLNVAFIVEYKTFESIASMIDVLICTTYVRVLSHNYRRHVTQLIITIDELYCKWFMQSITNYGDLRGILPPPPI